MARTDWKRPEKFDAPEGRRRVALEISYDGRAFCGWQTQNGQPSVQETVAAAVRKLVGEQNIEVCGSGRTDSGVHAYGQTAHIELDSNCTVPARAFCMGLNGFLPPGVRVRSARDVDNGFHARYSAMAREYRYFWREGAAEPFEKGLVTPLKAFPDLGLLNGYAECIRGTHDFTTFAGASDMSLSKFRDIYESEFFFTQSMYGYRVLCYKICGNAFLYRMVRSLAGTMLEFGQQGRPAEEFRAALEAADRRRCGKTAPPDGLYLWRVSYDPSEYLWFEPESRPGA